MSPGPQSSVDRMRGQAERAIASSKSRNTILPLLERLARAAEPGSEAARFAHRHLAEYLVEQNPWRALGHLRSATRRPSVGDPSPREGSDEDAVHALAGLAHALLGNFRSAIAAYRRAVALTPSNPWYQHNLGHLLDVGIDRPELALAHLEAAHRSAGPDDGEVSASLAHCLARLRRLKDALVHADVAVATCPDNADHVRLRDWIAAGAVEGDRTSPREDERRRAASPGAAQRAPAPSPVEPPVEREPVPTETSPGVTGEPLRPRRARRSPALAQLARRIRERLSANGHPARQVAEVLRLWDGYAATLSPAQLTSAGDAFWLALAEVAVAQLGARRASPDALVEIAARHGVAHDRLRAQWGELAAHRQKSGDPRRARR